MFAQTIARAAWHEIERIGQIAAERDDAWAVPRVSAEFLHSLVLAGGFRRGLEIGTSYGFSGLWLGAALQRNGGALFTIDNDAAKVAFAREAFGRAGLADTVHAVLGAAEEVLPETDGPFDFVFLDAEKKSTRRYFDLIWPLLAHRATIVTDNVTSHAEELAEFVAYLRQHPQLCSTLVPLGSGLQLTIKLDAYGAPATATLDGADWVI